MHDDSGHHTQGLHVTGKEWDLLGLWTTKPALGSQRCRSIRGEELGAGLGAPTMPPAALGQEHKAGPRCVCQVSSLREGGTGGQQNQELV